MPTNIINFAHANGFPAGSYQTLFSYLPDNMKIIALEKYGHDKQKPINHNWQAQVEELIGFVEAQREGNAKVICIGHSFGGVISFIACCQRPDLFKGLVMLDPPALSGAGALAARLVKKTKWIDKFSPAGRAKNRRSQWPLGSDIGSLFSGRKLFKSFDSRCLTDYVKHGICERNDQLELTFDAQVEANIFRNIPSNLSSYKNKLTVPATLVYGTETDVFPHHIFSRFVKLNKQIKLQTTPGGHMFPLESPEHTAKLIAEIVDSFPQD
jgi:pimeloyl-ACP methyl ester carboxylesterase